MRKFKYIVKYEDMISRIPGLFSYIEDNELGVSVLHKATDSLQGCYGKIVQNLKIGDDTYTYREMMDKYYSEYNTLEKGFKDFVEKGIGKVEVDILKDRKTYTLVPDFIYLSTANIIYDEYVKIAKQIEFYDGHLNNHSNDTDEILCKQQLCCLEEKYFKMGGDAMKVWLRNKVSEAERIAEEYYDYVSDNALNIQMKITLTNSVNDLGIITPCIEEWVPGRKYYKGEKIHYNNETYITLKDNSGYYNEETERIEFPYDMFEKETKFKFNGIENNEINLNGKVDGKLKSLRRFTEYLNVYDDVEKPENGKDWLYYYRIGYITNIETMNDEFGNIMMYQKDKPDEIEYYNEDGSVQDGNRLYAYGDVITNIFIPKDEYMGIQNELKTVPDNTIVFEYWLGVHLNTNNNGKEQDDDGNWHYYYTDFTIDADDKYHGVRYLSEFTFESGGELDTLIKNNMFDDYVIGNYDITSDADSIIDMFGKYEFNLYNTSYPYEKRISYQTTDVYTDMASFETTLKNEYDRQTTPLFRYDFYNSISFVPKKDIDVYINRGITSAFEKHIKFSEVKTLDDMLTYSNGSFFNVTETT